MGVGHQNHPLASGAQGVQKFQRVRVHRDQMRDFALEGHDIQRQFPGPVIQAIPGQRAFHRPGTGRHLGASLVERHLVALGVARRHQFPPELVVEPQIQQGAVHVEQDGANQRPGQPRGHGRALHQ